VWFSFLSSELQSDFRNPRACESTASSCSEFGTSVWYKPNTRSIFRKNYEGRLKISWILILVGTLKRCGDGLFFEVPPSLGKRCTSYNSPLTSQKRAADRLSIRNFFFQA
jgi:hypothetical protein